MQTGINAILTLLYSLRSLSMVYGLVWNAGMYVCSFTFSGSMRMCDTIAWQQQLFIFLCIAKKGELCAWPAVVSLQWTQFICEIISLEFHQNDEI